MTEDQSCQLPTGDNNLLGSTANNDIASGYDDFNKYDPYVERIRTLFVPSLEPRIHSCLETFVYRQESGKRSDPPYLKRCLDAAATLRDPVEAFCTKWRDSGFVETMLTSVVKLLISNGPIDCFLNSIILNNRLNKVCRDLDALGVEKDLLRYLAVWNYINERDYWLEEDKLISTSKSDESRDSTDRRSDLVVEVGSGPDSRRNDRSIRRAFKRRATDSSEDQDRSVRASQNFHNDGRGRVPFPSRLSIDSSNPEGSRSSSARKKIRSCQAHPCSPATCQTYRSKNPAPLNWEGKTLKLQLCKTSLASLDRRECRRSSELSELDLPCKSDDLIAEIFKADPISIRRFFAQGRKTFKAGATSVCSRVNETLGKIGRKEVARCRLHCEILPGRLSFRLIERDRDGSEVCLFSERVPIDRVDVRQGIPRRSSGSEPRQIGEQKNADGAELTIFKNSGFSPADDESRIVGSLEEAAIETEPEDILVRLSDVDMEAAVRKNVEQLIEQGRREASNRSSEDKVGEPMCGCNTSFDDEAARRRREDDEGEGSEPKSHPRESTGERLLNRSSGNAIGDDKLDRTAEDEAVDRNNVEGLARGESSMRSNENLTDCRKCTCSVSSDYTADRLDRAVEADLIRAADRQASGKAGSHEEIADSALEDAEEKDRREKLRRTLSNAFSREEYQPDVLTGNQLDNVACACPSDCTCPNRGVEEDRAEECDSKCSCDSCRRDGDPGVLKKTEIIRMSSLLKLRNETLDSAVQDSSDPNSTQRKGALVSASDELQCCCMEEDEPRALKKTEIIRMSSLLKLRTETLDSAVQDSSDPSSTQRKGALVSASDELQCCCMEEDEPRALKKTEIIRMSSLLKPRTESLDSVVQDSSDPNSTQRNEALVSASDELQCCCMEEDEPRALKKTEIIRMSSLLKPRTETLDPNSTQRNRALLFGSDEFQCGCVNAQSSTSHSQDLEFRERLSMKSDTPLEINETKTMSFIEAGSQRARPDRSSPVQQTSSATNKSQRNISSEEHPIVSARLPITKYQPDVPAYHQLDKIACACPSDCTCPNRGTKEDQPEECDSQCSCDTCRQEDESTPLKKTEIIRMSSLLRSHKETLDSVQDSQDPASTLKSGSFLVSTINELQGGCTEVQTGSFHSQDLENHEGPSTKSDSPLESNLAKTMSFVGVESAPAQPDRGSSVHRTSSSTNKTRRNISSEEHPIVPSRLSRPKGQRINISIEVCPESESSTERSRRNDRESANDEFQVRKDATSHRKSRRHSVEPQPSEKQVLLHPGKDTGDELLGQPRLTDAGARSPPRPLESRDYLPPFRPPSSMRNPIVYATSTGSARRSIGEMDERYVSQARRQRGDSCVTQNRHGSIPRRDQADEEVPKNSTWLPSRPDAFSSGLRTNVGHALSASSVDRMKHLIRTKLRRMLLERDKATNTPKTTLTNKKYRVSVPGAKTDRSSFGQQPCRTIWESRSASDSMRTSRSFVSEDCKSSAGIREWEEARKFPRSTGNPRISSRSRDCGGARRFDGVNSSRNSLTGRRLDGNDRAPEVDSGTDFPRLSGGSDFGPKMKRHENMHSSEKRENRCVSQNKNGGFEEKFMNQRLKEVPEEIGDSGKKIHDECAEFHGILRVAGNERAPEVDSEPNFPRLTGGSDLASKRERHENMHSSGKGENRCASQNKKAGIDIIDDKFTNHSFKEVPEEMGVSSVGNWCDAFGKKILDESSEFYGKLDWSGNSTSRHIYLFEFDGLGSSNDETESLDCCRSPRNTRLPEVRGTPGRKVDAQSKKLIVSRACDSRSSRGRSTPRDASAMGDCSGNMNNVSFSGVRRIGAFGNIDQDLRKKLSQYVSLCKNVKYALLKRLRPDDIYEVSRTSIPCCDR